MLPLTVTSPYEKNRVQAKQRKEGKTMTEITLKDGRTFNSRYASYENAIRDIMAYVWCEYNETIKESDIVKVETF